MVQTPHGVGSKHALSFQKADMNHVFNHLEEEDEDQSVSISTPHNRRTWVGHADRASLALMSIKYPEQHF